MRNKLVPNSIKRNKILMKIDYNNFSLYGLKRKFDKHVNYYEVEIIFSSFKYYNSTNRNIFSNCIVRRFT